MSLSAPGHYPEHPDIPGALPASVLAKAAYDAFAVWSDPSQYDLLSAAVLLNSRPSVDLALSLGAPVVNESSSAILPVLTYYHDNQEERKHRPDWGGSAHEGVQWLAFLLDQPSVPADFLENNGTLLLSEAIRFGNIPALEFLVDRGVSLDNEMVGAVLGGGVLHRAASYPLSASALSWLLPRAPGQINASDDQQMTPLLEAISAGHDQSARLLLAHGANPSSRNHREQNAFHLAASTALERKEQGAYITRVLDMFPADIIPELLSQYDDSGSCPIHDAALSASGLDWKRLAPKNDIDCPSAPGKAIEDSPHAPPITEVSALGVAFLMGNEPAVRELMSCGARLDRLSVDGHTGWHFLASLGGSGHKNDRLHLRKLVALLHSAGISPEQTTRTGIHPLAYSTSPWFDSYLSRLRRKSLSANQRVLSTEDGLSTARRPSGL